MCETETIRGLHVKDYHDLDPKALEEIICLNDQLENNLKEIREAIIKSDNVYALHYLEILLADNTSHTDYCITCQEDILANMEEIANNFEDYMNLPQESQVFHYAIPNRYRLDCPMSDDDDMITICLKAHEVPNGDCVDCTEPCCPQSFYGTP